MTYITAQTATTQLQAVNNVLSVIGEAPLASLENVTSLDASAAITELSTAMLEVMTSGYWFNTIRVTASPNDDGEIALPITYLTIKPVDPRDLYILKGGRLYDVRNNTYQISSPVELRVSVQLDWEDLPQQARTYIQDRAGRIYAQKQVGEKTMVLAAAQDERMSLAELQNENLRQLRVTRLDNYDIAAGFRLWR